MEALKQYQKTIEEHFVTDAYKSLRAIKAELGKHDLAFENRPSGLFSVG